MYRHSISTPEALFASRNLIVAVNHGGIVLYLTPRCETAKISADVTTFREEKATEHRRVVGKP